MDVPLHPSLQRLSTAPRRLLRVLGLLLALTLAGVLTFASVTAFSSGDAANLWLLGLIVLTLLPSAALLGGLLWYLNRWLSRQLSVADRLLRECAPLSARLTPTGLTGRNGVLVALRPLLKAHAAAGPLYALLNPSFCWSCSPRREITVELYCQGLKPGNELVALQSDGNALLGKLVTWEAYSRDLRRLVGAALALVLLAVAVMGTLAIQGYRAYRGLEQERWMAEASRSWPQVPGTVLRGQLKTSRIARGKSWITAYQARVEFTYPVAGVMRHGDTPYFCDQPTPDRRVAETWLAKYPAGAAVAVHYDPANPDRSVLEAGYPAACEAALSEKQLEVVFAGTVLGFLLLIVLVVLRQFWKYRQASP